MSQIKVEISLEMLPEDAADVNRVEAGIAECAKRLREGVRHALTEHQKIQQSNKRQNDVPATTILNEAMREYHNRTGMVPKVALLAPWLYDKYEHEQRRLDGILPDGARLTPSDDVKHGGDYADIRLLEDHRVQGIEVF